MPKILDKINFNEFLERNKENENEFKEFIKNEGKNKLITITGTSEVSLEERILFVLHCLDTVYKLEMELLRTSYRNNVIIKCKQTSITSNIKIYLTAGKEIHMENIYNYAYKSPYANNNYYQISDSNENDNLIEIMYEIPECSNKIRISKLDYNETIEKMGNYKNLVLEW